MYERPTVYGGNIGEKCVLCGKHVTQDEIGLNKKLINRGVTKFYCIECLSQRISVPVPALKEKIIQFRRMGCTLFQ